MAAPSVSRETRTGISVGTDRSAWNYGVRAGWAHARVRPGTLEVMPRILLVTGAALLALTVLLAVTMRHSGTGSAVPATTSTSAAPPTTTAPLTTPLPSPPTTTQALPAPVSMSWRSAGGMIWHASDIDPTWLGQQMRAAGFGWIAVYLGGPEDPGTADASWIQRFQAASGLPVGGWSVLGDDPAHDVASSVSQIKQFGLAFYIADAEEPYGYTDMSGKSPGRFARSRQFVQAFRAAEPTLPAAVSSYCRPDEHDIDWSAWVHGGFQFLPQAYVNALGASVAPAACVEGAVQWFPKSAVHPTVGSYQGALGFVSPERYATLLHQAGTSGFSIYPAEVGLSDQDWQAYGAAIASLGIAQKSG